LAGGGEKVAGILPEQPVEVVHPDPCRRRGFGATPHPEPGHPAVGVDVETNPIRLHRHLEWNRVDGVGTYVRPLADLFPVPLADGGVEGDPAWGVALEIAGVDFEAMDGPGEPQPHHHPVVAGTAPAGRLPAVPQPLGITGADEI